MNSQIQKIEQDYLSYLDRKLKDFDTDTIEMLDRYADCRNLSTAQKLEIERSIGFDRSRLYRQTPTVVNVNVFNGCQVNIGSIGS